MSLLATSSSYFIQYPDCINSVLPYKGYLIELNPNSAVVFAIGSQGLCDLKLYNGESDGHNRPDLQNC